MCVLVCVYVCVVLCVYMCMCGVVGLIQWDLIKTLLKLLHGDMWNSTKPISSFVSEHTSGRLGSKTGGNSSDTSSQVCSSNRQLHPFSPQVRVDADRIRERRREERRTTLLPRSWQRACGEKQEHLLA